jgi:hypothetical protein
MLVAVNAATRRYLMSWNCEIVATVRSHRTTLLAEAERERLAAKLPRRRGWWSAARTALGSLPAR